jgi:hypothetical protein
MKNFRLCAYVLIIFVSAFAVWNFLSGCDASTSTDGVVSKSTIAERPVAVWRSEADAPLPHPVPPSVIDLSPVPFVGDAYTQNGYWIQELRHGWLVIKTDFDLGMDLPVMAFVPKPDVQ